MMPRRVLLLLLGIVAGSAACSRTAEFGPERTVPAKQRPTIWGTDDKTRLQLPDMRPPKPNEARIGDFTGPVPEGWRALRPAPERFRHLWWAIEGEKDAECYLTAGVGGGLQMNLGRWYRDQFDLPVPDAQQIAALPDVQLLGAPGKLIELFGTFRGRDGEKPDFGMLLVTSLGEVTDSVKFTGPAEVIRREKQRFLDLVPQIRAAAASGAGDPDVAQGPKQTQPAAQDPTGELSARPPGSWVAQPATGMRLLNFKVDDAEVYVSRLGGDISALLNVWTAEMQRPDLDEAARAALPRVPMLGGDAVLLDLEGDWKGMSGERKGARMLVAAIAQRDGATFAKMIGSAAAVGARRDEFLAFVKSLERQP